MKILLLLFTITIVVTSFPRYKPSHRSKRATEKSYTDISEKSKVGSNRDDSSKSGYISNGGTSYNAKSDDTKKDQSYSNANEKTNIGYNSNTKNNVKSDYESKSSQNSDSSSKGSINDKTGNNIKQDTSDKSKVGYITNEKSKSDYNSKSSSNEKTGYNSKEYTGEKSKTGNNLDDKSKSGYSNEKTGYNSNEYAGDKSKTGYNLDDKSKSGYSNDKTGYNLDDKSKSGYANEKTGYNSKEYTGEKSKTGYNLDDKSKSGYTKEKTGYNSKEYFGDKSKTGYNLDDKSKFGYINEKTGYKYTNDYNGDFGEKMKIRKELYFFSAPGHCKPICPCYMNGITYDHGNRWHSKDNPCTTYECGNGFYFPVTQGVRYKGECKNVGIPWTEGCFTYEVMLIENIPTYRLIEGGCEDDSGNCWKVGDQFRRNCNLYECQIVGTCYTISVISKGCTFEGECKEVNNYWHDGCSIYQCSDYNGNTSYAKLNHEIMYWPEGNYGLLKPKSGCPLDVAEEWSEGYRGHFGNGHNYKSYDFDAFGDYKDYYFIHHFCIRQQVNDASIIPRYQTYWEPGKYCIFRKNGTCPENFQEGYVGMDDLDVTEQLSSINGTIPDGVYIKDTSFYFCCRDDGKVDDPIVLPKERPFILFVGSSAEDCQKVRGMTHTLEYFAFDDTDANPKPIINGSVPMTKTGDNNTEIYFCHYKPMSCGCDDGDGNTIIVGDRVQKGCAWYICKDLAGVRILSVDVGGCLDETGKCRNESEVWMVSTGETCFQKRCLRVDTGTKILFEVKQDYKGCKDEEFCRPVGYSFDRGCYSSICNERPDRPECYFKMQKAGCSDGMGGCVALGLEFTRGCMTYQCSIETTKCGMKFLRGACKYDDGCHEVDSVWHHSSCNKLKCSMSKKNDSITFSIDSVEQECNYKGQCYAAGYRIKEGCYLRECQVDTLKRLAYMNIIDGGCQWNTVCKGVNETWNDGCTQYICRWYQENNQHIFKTDINKKQCTFGTECVNQGEIRKQGCIEYECSVTSNSTAYYSVMKPYRTACQDKNGNCLALNEQLEENCFLYKCQQGTNGPELAIIGGGCKINGVCKAENSIWTDDSNCVNYKCERENREDKIYMVTSPVAVGCLHNGICRQHGEKWPTPDKACFKTECSVSKEPNNSFKRQLTTSPDGCIIDGVCQPYNYTNYVGCIQYKCEWDSLRQFATYRYTKGGCREYSSSKCHDVGDVWEEKYGTRTCLKLTCKQIDNTFQQEVKYMCQDADGFCVNPGEQFVSLVSGKRLKCNCKANGDQVSAVCGSG